MLEEAAQFMTDFGIVDILLPLVLLFTLLYALFKRLNLFGNKNINATIAIALSLIVVASTDTVKLISTFISNASILIIVAVMLLMILGLGGLKTHSKTPITKWIITIFFVITVAYTFNQAGIITQQHLDLFLVPGIAIIVLLAILIALFSPSQKPQTSKETQKTQAKPANKPTHTQKPTTTPEEETEKAEQRLVKQKRIEIPEGEREL